MQTDQREIADHLQLYEDLYQQASGLSGLALPEPGAVREFVAGWVAAWEAHDIDAIVALCTEDVVWEDPVMLGDHARGHAQIREFTEMFFASFPDVTFTPVGPPHFALGSESIMQAWRGAATFDGDPLPAWPPGSRGLSFAPTGRRFEIPGVDVYEFRDMRVRRWRILYDPTDLSRQLGLLPDPRGRAARLLELGQRASAPLLRRRARAS